MACIRVFSTTVLLVAISASHALAADAASNEKEIAAIRAAANAYISALEQGKPETLAAAWTPDGNYVDAAGRSFKARDMIATEFRKGVVGHRAPQVTIDGIRLVAPEVAVEDGHLLHAPATGERPQRSRYTAIWVKQGSRWLLDSLREAVTPQAPSNARLAEIKWLLGDFAGRSLDGLRMIATGSMSSDGNFLLREFYVTLPDGTRRRSASQRIGWDPLTGGLKSWTFHSDGGYGEGVWKRQGDVWIVNNSGVSADGRRTSSTTIYSKITDESMIVSSVGTMVEDKSEPDVKLQLKRQPPKE